MKRLGALFLAIPLSGMGILGMPPLSAAAAEPECYEGTFLSGAIPCGESPLILEKQQVTLSIGEFPEVGGGAVYPNVPAAMQCAYTFSNPTEEAASVELLLPCVPAPLYAVADSANGTQVIGADAEDRTVRYSYAGYFSRSYDLSAGIKQLSSPADDDFYAQEGLTVTEYRFRVDLSAQSLREVNRKYVAFVLTFECNPMLSRVISRKMYTEIVNGKLQASFDVEAGESEILLTVVGEDIVNLHYGLYVDRYLTKELEIGSLSYQKDAMPFADYALQFRPEDSEISARDWLAGFIYMLNKSTTNRSVIYAFPELIREEAFLKWYDYRFTVPPKSKAVHTVESLVYPTVEGERYEYALLLRPQLAWKQGGIDIEIRTPYVLAYSTLDFAETSSGYALSRDRLPMDDLMFTLVRSNSAMGTTQSGATSAPISPSMRLALILLGVLGGAALLGGGIAAVVLAAKKKKR